MNQSDSPSPQTTEIQAMEALAINTKTTEVQTKTEAQKRPRKYCCENLTPENVEKAKLLMSQGVSLAAISREVGISRYYLRQLCDGVEIPTNGQPRPALLQAQTKMFVS